MGEKHRKKKYYTIRAMPHSNQNNIETYE
jgi:hypothetical protein